MTDFNFDEAKQSAKQVLTELELPDLTHTRCLAILDDVQTKNILTERNADGIIAGAIYIAAIQTKNRLTQKLLSDVMDISESTIRKYYVALVKVLDLKKMKT